MLRLRDHTAIVSVGQSWWRCWRVAMERLEHADVEHIVKARTRRHLETIGDRVNPLENLVGPIEPWSILAAARTNKRFRWSVMQTKPTGQSQKTPHDACYRSGACHAAVLEEGNHKHPGGRRHDL
jgi:hypothetical protein